MEQLLQAIQEQNQLLKKLLVLAAENSTKPNLGFHDDLNTIKIYCNRQHNTNWYRIINGEVLPITSIALTGYIRSLEFEKTERRGKEVWKCLTTIQADKMYILESGHDTQFTKSLVAVIATLVPDDLHKPVTISPRQGDDDSVLFCRMWIENQYIKGEYNQETDFKPLAKQAIAVVKAANGVEF